MLFGHRPILVLLFSQRLKSGEFVFMQDCAPCSAHRAKTTQDDLRNVVSDFAVEKTSGSTVAVTEQDGHQFKLVKATDNFVFFCILTCNTTLLSISVKVRNINVDICVRINEYLLIETMHL